MFVEQVLRQYVNAPVMMLDLCAAPGGKSTHARSVLPEGSLLVANEVIRNRSQVLAENLTKWGHPDVVVTNNDPADFSALSSFFDVILTDVPCSGEGMFRKDPVAVEEWSPENVEICWQRQRRIIADIWPCLKPGGILIYSTCTYNSKEDEENVCWIQQEFGAELLPLEVQDLEDEIAGLDTRIEKIDTEIKEFQSAITMKKGEVQEAQANLERYNNQLNEVRNNREYDSLSKQIDYERLEVELCNKKIKEATDQVAYRTNDLEIAKTEREERQKDLDEKKSELEDILAETREEETMLKERAKDLEVKIEPRLLSSFKRIRKSARNGLGIVYVQRDACGGCFNKIPPQRQLDIKMHKKIIVCEYCGRILIDPELAGVKVENGKAEKPKRKRSTRRKADTEEKKEA